MDESLFRDLEIRAPDVNLAVGVGSHASQVAGVLTGLEPVLRTTAPDLVVVVGDHDSTLAAALAAVKLHIPVAHLGAGHRSGDRRMPEEINRVLTDRISSLCLTTTRAAAETLARAGIDRDRIHFVGNITVDALLFAKARCHPETVLLRHGVEPGGYGLVSLHRPSNVEDGETFRGVMQALEEIARERPLIFPAHPPPYLEMVALLDNAAVVLTDSDGLQEASTALGVPCLTLRSTTEHPITVSEGTNVLVPDRRPGAILEAYRALGSEARHRRAPARWDGRTASRIVRVLDEWSQGSRPL